MFGFNVLTWNTGYQEHAYLQSITKMLSGGSPGHAAAELVIPLTQENRDIINEINTQGKLLVREETTLISCAIDEKPYFKAVEVPCFKIYFSFWDDASTLKTPQRHMMVGPDKDKIVKRKENPIEYSAKGKRILMGDQGATSSGRSMMMETIQHMDALSPQQKSLSQIKFQLLEEIKEEKELLLKDIKKISVALNRLTKKEKQQTYLSSKTVQEILTKHQVTSFEQLKLELAVRSAAITNLQYELTQLGVSFGAPPDDIVSFPITDQLDSGLDYKQILREMGRIANSQVPYTLTMNCAAATLTIIRAGVSDELKSKLKAEGYSLPKSNTFVETPQSVFDFSLKISTMLVNINAGIKETHRNLFTEFSLRMHHFFNKVLSKLFKTSYQQQLKNQKMEYSCYLAAATERLIQCDEALAAKTMSQGVYSELQQSLDESIHDYTKKIAEINRKLINSGANGAVGFFEPYKPDAPNNETASVNASQSPVC